MENVPPLQTCPNCGVSGLVTEFAEFETLAGDYVNEYEITRCPNCDFKREECIGGHCSESWNLEE
jgi:DNA-directed RNA polymerase subunit RPC12/RpoP